MMIVQMHKLLYQTERAIMGQLLRPMIIGKALLVANQETIIQKFGTFLWQLEHPCQLMLQQAH